MPPGISPTGAWRNHCPQLYAFILGPKRYAFYNVSADGSVIVRKCSEHGLGMRLDPTNPAAPVTAAEDEESEPQIKRIARPWIVELWRYLIERHALHRDAPEPSWFDVPALSKISMTQPDTAKRLGLWPFNFCLVAQVHPLSRRSGEGLRLIAPFELDARKWLRMRRTDARTGERAHYNGSSRWLRHRRAGRR